MRIQAVPYRGSSAGKCNPNKNSSKQNHWVPQMWAQVDLNVKDLGKVSAPPFGFITPRINKDQPRMEGCEIADPARERKFGHRSN